MIETVALGAALLAGVRHWRLLLLAAVLWAPVALVPAVAYVAIRGRKAYDDRPALFCVTVASELRAGTDLRRALEAASSSVGIELQTSEIPHPLRPDQVARVAAAHLSGIGRELEATVSAVARSGGSAADLFDELASYAIARSEVDHELRIATAPARATAWFFASFPVALVMFQVQRGALSRMLALPLQRVTALAGLGLFVLGLVAMVAVMVRAR